MTSIVPVLAASFVAAAVGVSGYLLAQGRMPEHGRPSPSPWIIFAGRLCFLTVSIFSVLVLRSALVALAALGFFFASLVIEMIRRGQIVTRPGKSA